MGLLRKKDEPSLLMIVIGERDCISISVALLTNPRAYGKYITFFQPPPKPSCLPPPDNHRLPCPRHAKHLLVSSGMQTRMFGHQFNEQFQDPHGVEVKRQKNIFAMLRDGYETLFKLADGDKGHAERQIEKYNSMVRESGGLEIGLHIRHGDKHPWEFQYQKSYIPTAHYVDVAEKLVQEAFSSSNGSQMDERMKASKIIVASDDPESYGASELEDSLKAQEKIVLASKFQEDAANGGNKNVDDGTGWEGGFFEDMFWGLGANFRSALSLRKRDLGTQNEDRIEPSELALQLRGLIGRSYLLDLVVTGQTDRIVCTVSSIGCRLLAVMMGWEDAIARKSWRNVDGDFDWVGIRW